MQHPRFAIYTRISRDRVGAGLGVERQQADCDALVKQLGGELVAVYTDNDISAYSGKYRPGYEALLTAVANREIDSVATWHQDRLLRRTLDLEHYIDVCQPQKVSTHTVKAGYFDLTTPAGRATAKTLAAWASYEIETSTDRVKASKLQAAQAGLPSGGNRPYGYAQNGIDIVEEEAVVVAEVVERFVAGESWRQIAFDLNARSIPTAKGNQWAAINVRNVAVRPRNIAIREHNGNQYPAQWQPLIDQELWDDLQLTIKRGTAMHGSRSYTRIHMLTGFIYCGVCGCRMKIINAQNRDGSYAPAFACRKKDHRGDIVGCGTVKRRRDPIDDLIRDCVFHRLDTPDLEALLSMNQTNTDELRQLINDQERQQLRLQEVLEAYSTGDMTMSEWKSAKSTAQERLDSLGKKIAKLITHKTLATVPAGKTVTQAWEENGIAWRRELLNTLIDKIYIDPRIKGQGFPKYKQWRFDPELVRITWKA